MKVLTGFGVDTGLVREGTETSDVVVEGDVHFDIAGHQVLDLLELFEVVFLHDVVAVNGHHSGHQTPKRRDSIPLADTEHRSVNVRRACLQSAEGIGDSAARVVLDARSVKSQ
jgi:hypothetical protein